MLELSQRLIDVASRWNINNYSSAFDQITGSRRYSQKAIYRIGFWPIVSSSDPETAMGIGLVLAALVEQWPSVRAYRLMAEVDESTSSYEWSIDKSQFGVDDWEVEGLDENVALWGTFEIIDDHVQFSVEVENDASEDDETLKLNYKENSLVDLLNLLPAIAEKIMTWITPMLADRVGDQYAPILDGNGPLLRGFLRQLFQWEKEYFFVLRGQPNESVDPSAGLESLVELSRQMKCDFGAWILCQSISRFIILDNMTWSSSLIPYISGTVEALGDYPVFVSIICMTLFRLDYGPEVYDLLEANLASHPENSIVWNTLAAIYSALREDLSTIDVYQRAIETKSAIANTYRRYADLIILLNNQQIQLKMGNQHVSPAGRPFIERYVLTDPEQDLANLHEASAAYQAAFEQNLDDLEVLMLLVICLITLEDQNLWMYCQKLVELDIEGEITASVIDQLADDKIPFMIEILQKTLLGSPQHMNIRINLVRCYLAIEEYDKANDELASISKNGLSQQNQLLVVRLSLAAQIDDFESRIAEIDDVLGANGKITDTDIEFLEMLIEKEPTFSEGYGLLAKAYLSRNEQDAALEVLLDCQNQAPFNPEVTGLLAKVLWDEDESDLAFAYLEKGLEQDGNNATLLSLNARFLFANGQDEDAKEMLLQAEESDPTNAELIATRRYIANTLIASKKE